MNSNENNVSRIAQFDNEDSVEEPRPRPPLPTGPALAEDRADAQQPTGHATREGSEGKAGIEKSKLILLGGGLLAAVLFLALTSLINRSSTTNKATVKQPSHSAQQQTPSPSKGSVTPLMETVQTNAQENTSGQVHPGDIKRTSTPAPGAGDYAGAALPAKPHAGSAASANTLGAIPSFSDTQQKWEEPQPYGDTSHASPVQAQQTQNALKEASLVFVRAPSQAAVTGRRTTGVLGRRR
ncbi:MAG TPA: hypothetical protein VGF01_11340 [Terracidiphilus sp.]|jgi:hypothetical protein